MLDVDLLESIVRVQDTGLLLVVVLIVIVVDLGLVVLGTKSVILVVELKHILVLDFKLVCVIIENFHVSLIHVDELGKVYVLPFKVFIG